MPTPVIKSDILYNQNKVKKKNSHQQINPLNAELNPICHLLALLRAHHILHVSRIRVKRGLNESLKRSSQIQIS
jgi:hypothetical protein